MKLTPQPLAPAILLSVSMNMTLLETSWKQNHAAAVLLGPASITQAHVLQPPPPAHVVAGVRIFSSGLITSPCMDGPHSVDLLTSLLPHFGCWE